MGGREGFGATFTSGHLQQKRLIDDDCLAFTYENFERVLIFDRKPITDDGYSIEKNLNKEAFLRLFHLLMTLLVHTDENAQGYFGIVKPARRPEPIKFKIDM